MPPNAVIVTSACHLAHNTGGFTEICKNKTKHLKPMAPWPGCSNSWLWHGLMWDTPSLPKACRALFSMAEAFISHIQEIPNLPTGLTGLCLTCLSYTQVLEWQHNGLWWGGPTSHSTSRKPQHALPCSILLPCRTQEMGQQPQIGGLLGKELLGDVQIFLAKKYFGISGSGSDFNVI